MIQNPKYSLAEIDIKKTIRRSGPITFANFMELALYHADGGYYTNRVAFGSSGDFFTAPITHPLFGSLIAVQIKLMWQKLGMNYPLNVIELGAGNGQLGIDMKAHFERMSNGSSEVFDYIGNDLSSKPSDFLGKWIQGEIPFKFETHSVIVANELLDAMPVHRVTVDQAELKEIFIGLDEAGDFQEVLSQPSTSAIKEHFEELGIELTEGYRTEVNLGITKWFKYVFEMIDSGYLLLIDYGHEAGEYYNSHRSKGTLRCYYSHTLNMNPYIHVGKQDISSHVDFTTLRKVALDVGFDLMEEKSQSQFLSDLGFDRYKDKIASNNNLNRVTKNTNLRLLELLMDEAGMGSFRVFIFAKNILDPFTNTIDYNEIDVPLVLATPRHMPRG